jgi:hypothetical protein
MTTLSGGERRENSFTPEDRKLLKDVDEKVTTINGDVKRNKEELFGDRLHGTVGVVSRVRILEDLAIQIKTAVRVLIVIGTILGATNVYFIITGGT